MTGIFLSYSRSDRQTADDVVKALQRLGVDVWWDEEMPGVDWQAELERQISQLAGVVVLWTPASTASKNVRDEARLALNFDKLVNVIVGVPQPPFPFDRVNALPLDGWTTDQPHGGFTRLVETIEAYLVRVGTAQAGQLTALLDQREADISAARAVLAAAERALPEAEAQEAETTAAASEAAQAMTRADEQLAGVATLRASPMVLRAAHEEADAARQACDEARRAHRAAVDAQRDATRNLARAKDALAAVMAAKPRPPEIRAAPPAQPKPADLPQAAAVQGAAQFAAAPQVAASAQAATTPPVQAATVAASQVAAGPTAAEPRAAATTAAPANAAATAGGTTFPPPVVAPKRRAPWMVFAGVAGGLVLVAGLAGAMLPRGHVSDPRPYGVTDTTSGTAGGGSDTTSTTSTTSGDTSGSGSAMVASPDTTVAARLAGNWTKTDCNSAHKVWIEGELVHSMAGDKDETAMIDSISPDGRIHLHDGADVFSLEVSGNTLTARDKDERVLGTLSRCMS